MDKRGFSIIGLHNPKNGENVGGALRAASIFGASGVLIDGHRSNTLLNHPTNTMKAHNHIPTTWCNDIFDAIPYGTVPIAVDIVDGARSLVEFTHPERAVYIFGAEDSTLGKKTIDRCVHTVYIPTRRCANLAATVNMVLYDRMAKRGISFNTEGGAGLHN